MPIPETLVYETSPRPFITPESAAPHSEQVGTLTITEARTADTRAPYKLRITAEVHNKEEADDRHAEALALADELDIIWPYVAGAPLFPKRAVLAIRDAPEGWSTNLQQVKATLPSTQALYGSLQISPGSFHITLPYMPLSAGLTALRSYQGVGKETKVLISLHYDSMQHQGEEAGLFLLAKALELARVMLPGNTDARRESALPTDARTELRRSLHWLYEMSNRRLEIRHVLNQKHLLPRLTPAERRDFVHDADLVIRGVVELKMGVQTAIMR